MDTYNPFDIAQELRTAVRDTQVAPSEVVTYDTSGYSQVSKLRVVKY